MLDEILQLESCHPIANAHPFIQMLSNLLLLLLLQDLGHSTRANITLSILLQDMIMESGVGDIEGLGTFIKAFIFIVRIGL